MDLRHPSKRISPEDVFDQYLSKFIYSMHNNYYTIPVSHQSCKIVNSNNLISDFRNLLTCNSMLIFGNFSSKFIEGLVHIDIFTFITLM